VEPLAVLEYVEGERHLHALPLLLDTQQGALQVQPERDLLRMRGGQSHISFHKEILFKERREIAGADTDVFKSRRSVLHILVLKNRTAVGRIRWNSKSKRSVLLLQSVINCFFYFVFI
jgi:hypothetical protein